MDGQLRKKSLKKFKFISKLCLAISLVYIFIGIFDYNWKYDKEDNQFQKREELSTSSFFEKYSDHSYDLYYTKETKSLKKWYIDKRIDHYNRNISNLKSALFNIIVFIILGSLVVFYKPKGIQVSFFSLTIQEELLYIIIAFGIIYTWSNFGLEFNAAIDSRLAIHHNLMSVFEGNIHHNMNYEQRPLHLLVDNGLIDNWCSFFFDIFRDEAKWDVKYVMKPLEMLGLFGLYGTFIGTLFSTFFVIIVEFGVRKPKFYKLSQLILIFGFILIFLTCVGWIVNHFYASLFAAYCWMTASILIFLWQYKGIGLSNKLQVKV